MIIALTFDITHINFYLHYFYLMKCLMELVFIKCSNNLFIFSLITYFHGTQYFFISLIKKTFSDQLALQLYVKIFLYLGILKPSPTLNFISLLLCSTPHSIYTPSITSAGLIVIALYVMLYLLTILSSLLMSTFLILQSCL